MLLLPLITLAALHSPEDPVTTLAPVRYRIDQQIESRLDLTAFGQGEQIQTQQFTWFMTLALSDSAEGRAMHVVLDSVHADLGAVSVSSASLDRVRGAAFHGYLDDWGRVQSLSGPKGGIFLGLFEAQVKGFLPRWKPGTRQGGSWTDTLTIDTDTPQGSTNVEMITVFRLVGEEMQDSVPATRIEASFTASTTGTLQTPSGAADVTGEGNGTATYFMARDGHLLRSTTTGSGEALLAASFVPTPIPIKTSTSVQVTRIK